MACLEDRQSVGVVALQRRVSKTVGVVSGLTIASQGASGRPPEYFFDLTDASIARLEDRWNS